MTNAALVRALVAALRAAAQELEREAATDTAVRHPRIPSAPDEPVDDVAREPARGLSGARAVGTRPA